MRRRRKVFVVLARQPAVVLCWIGRLRKDVLRLASATFNKRALRFEDRKVRLPPAPIDVTEKERGRVWVRTGDESRQALAVGVVSARRRRGEPVVRNILYAELRDGVLTGFRRRRFAAFRKYWHRTDRAVDWAPVFDQVRMNDTGL